MKTNGTLPKGDPITGASNEMCDSFIKHANELGMTRPQMIVVCGTLLMNHCMATGVSRERVHRLVDGFWNWRRGRRPSDKLLVKAIGTPMKDRSTE